MKKLAWSITKTFFTSSEIVHKENVPLNTPLLIVVNHNNQFVDAAVVYQALPIQASFIIAESSMHKCLVGDIARAMNSVPVIRPQDRAVSGQGLIVEVDLERNVLIGENSAFTKEGILQKGAKIDVKNVLTFSVVEILSDTEVSFKLDEDEDGDEKLKHLNHKLSFGEKFPFKILPYVDQNEVYKVVHERLAKNAAIVIFPEGGSHDRTTMLPLKAGVAVMGLGAMKAGVENLRILPVGINYFNAPAFRSRVLVEMGESFAIPTEIYEKYVGGNRREAYQEVMELVRQGMQDVTLNAPDYKTQKIIRVMRRLYQNGSHLEAAEYLKLYRRFLKGYETWKDDDRFQTLMKDISNYMHRLDGLGIQDKSLEMTSPSNSCCTALSSIFHIIITIFVMTVLMLIALPGVICNLPLYLIIKSKVESEVKKALSKSKVKVKAFDVAASQKVLNTMKYLPVVYIFDSVVVLLLLFFLYEQRVDPQDTFLEDNLFWLLPVILLFLLPAYSFFVIIVTESAWKGVRLLPSRFYVIWQAYSRNAPTCLGGKTRLSPEADIRVKRRNLIIRTQQLVGDLTKDDAEWQEEPIISQADMIRQRTELTERVVQMAERRQSDQTLLANMGDLEIDKFLQSRSSSKRGKTGSFQEMEGKTAVSNPTDLNV